MTEIHVDCDKEPGGNRACAGEGDSDITSLFMLVLFPAVTCQNSVIS